MAVIAGRRCAAAVIVNPERSEKKVNSVNTATGKACRPLEAFFMPRILHIFKGSSGYSGCKFFVKNHRFIGDVLHPCRTVCEGMGILTLRGWRKVRSLTRRNDKLRGKHENVKIARLRRFSL